MIWIIGGTSEARKLVERISDMDNFIVTVATNSGREFLNIDNLKVARMSLEEMLYFVGKNNIRLIIDMTHPYAKIVTENAKIVAKQKNIDYVRYSREKTYDKDGIILKSYEEAYKYIKNLKGNIFFTTGSNHIENFEKVKGDNRFIYRVLPALESIKKCADNKVHLRDIVAVLGPFSKDYNKTMFKEYGADYVVMKDSGKTGGTQEKIDACKELGIKAIIIDRLEEFGFTDLRDLEKYIRKNMSIKSSI